MDRSRHGLSVSFFSHDRVPCKNGLTDRDTVWTTDSRMPKGPWIRWVCTSGATCEYDKSFCVAAAMRAVATVSVATCYCSFMLRNYTSRQCGVASLVYLTCAWIAWVAWVWRRCRRSRSPRRRSHSRDQTQSSSSQTEPTTRTARDSWSTVHTAAT